MTQDFKNPTPVLNLRPVPLEYLIQSLKFLMSNLEASTGSQASLADIDKQMKPILAEIRRRIINGIKGIDDTPYGLFDFLWDKDHWDKDDKYPGIKTHLGLCYEYGFGVSKDLDKAMLLYQSAAKKGDARAQANLAEFYRVGTAVKKDEKEAVRLYRLAADQGLSLAQSNLGFLYECGMGVEKDNKEAVRLYQLAANQNDTGGQTNLGRCYENGIGVKKDEKEAVRLYRLAADQGLAYSQNVLGKCYSLGIGVPKDFNQAISWFRKDTPHQTNDYFLNKITEYNPKAFSDAELYKLFDPEKIYNAALKKEDHSKNILAADQKLTNLTTKQRTEIGKRWPNLRDQILKSDEKIDTVTIKAWAKDKKTPDTACVHLLTNANTFNHLTVDEWVTGFMNLQPLNQNLALAKWLKEEKEQNNKIVFLNKFITKPSLLIKILQKCPQYADDILKLATEKAILLEIGTQNAIQDLANRHFFKNLQPDAETNEKSDSEDELVLKEKLIRTFINEVCDFDNSSTSTSGWLPWSSNTVKKDEILQKINHLDCWESTEDRKESTADSERFLSPKGKENFVILLLDLYYKNETLKDKTTFREKYETVKSSYPRLGKIIAEVDNAIGCAYKKDNKGEPKILPVIESYITRSKQKTAGSVIFNHYKNMPKKSNDEIPTPTPSAPPSSGSSTTSTSDSSTIVYPPDSRPPKYNPELEESPEDHSDEAQDRDNKNDTPDLTKIESLYTDGDAELVMNMITEVEAERKKCINDNPSEIQIDPNRVEGEQDIGPPLLNEGRIVSDPMKEEKDIDNSLPDEEEIEPDQVEGEEIDNPSDEEEIEPDQVEGEENKKRLDSKNRNNSQRSNESGPPTKNSYNSPFWDQSSGSASSSSSLHTPIPKESKEEIITLLYDENQQITAWKKDGVLKEINKDQLLDALIAEPDLLERLSDVARGRVLGEARKSLPSAEQLELDKLVLDFLIKSRENQLRISQQKEGVNPYTNQQFPL